MPSYTTNMLLAKAVDGDNAENYLAVLLNQALDIVDTHDHSATSKGLPVGRIQTATTPAVAGAVQIAGDSLQWWGSSAGAVKTAVDLDSAQTLTNKSVGLAAGAVGAPSLSPTGDTNTGLWFPAADTIAVSTGGSERLRVDANGFAALGTTLTDLLGLGPSRRAFTVLSPAGAVPAHVVIGAVGTAGNTSQALGQLEFIGLNGGSTVVGRATILASLDGATNSANLAFYAMSAGVLAEKMRLASDGSVVHAGGTTRTAKAASTNTVQGSGGAYVTVGALPANSHGVLHVSSAESGSGVTSYATLQFVTGVSAILGLASVTNINSAVGANSQLTFQISGLNFQAKGVNATAPTGVKWWVEYASLSASAG